MTPQDFVRKWKEAQLKESAAAQEHFLDLCAMLQVAPPAMADPKGEWYTFEKGAVKTAGTPGFADVWKRGFFGWEYKGPGGNLQEAYAQLQRYAPALENPPLLIVSDLRRFHIHANWTNTVHKCIELTLDDLLDGDKRQILSWAFTDPEQLKPGKTRQQLTEEVAAEFVTLAKRLRDRGHDPQAVAHFVCRLVFCMFAEHVDLLPNRLFTELLEASRRDPAKFPDYAAQLFAKMKSGGDFHFKHIEWFNGGLFDDDAALPLEAEDIKLTLEVSGLDWSSVDPAIMGTLFERGLDPDKRSQLGAHYTDRKKIMLIVNPVVAEPLLREWKDVKDKISGLMGTYHTHSNQGQRTRAYNEAVSAHHAFVEKLKNFRVLDPACGSGNFLYLSLLKLKDIEHQANLDAEALGLPRMLPSVGPECVKGIEINPFAAELARVSVWIGEIQWMRKNGFGVSTQPVLKPLNTIECRDALLNPDGSETDWPNADVIVGNPPFLGAKLMKGGLGIDPTNQIRGVFAGRLPGFTDFVCYWFEKSRAMIEEGRTRRAGLVATNSIAKNTNLPVMRRIAETALIYEAWRDEPWIVEGAAVRVAIICFGAPSAVVSRRLDGAEVTHINPNLTTGLDISIASQLSQNSSVSFLGIQKSGPFDIAGNLARTWMRLAMNPNGRSNSEVLKPYWNGSDISDRPRDFWIIDFRRDLPENEAALFEIPFEYLKEAKYVPDRSKPPVSFAHYRQTTAAQNPSWWEQHRPRPEMRAAIASLSRYLVTGETTEHRLFIWLKLPVLPDKNLIVIARDDDTAFGILQSRIHEAWATGIGNRMGVGNQRRYNSSYIFETFPFPTGLTPNIPASGYASDPHAIAIAEAARRLNELRENWLNPADLVKRVPEVVPGYPDRILPISDEAAVILKKRTLTNLYNERPAWLDHAHRALDEAVAAAYSWPADLSDEQILERLFQLNQERAMAQAAK
jgi:type II restriction/modification system DNA methylase subunit YeeA